MRIMIGILVVLLVVLQYKLWFSKDGAQAVSRMKQAIHLKQDENKTLSERNKAIGREVDELKQGKAAAVDKARHDLGMVKQDETYYQFIN